MSYKRITTTGHNMAMRYLDAIESDSESLFASESSEVMCIIAEAIAGVEDSYARSVTYRRRYAQRNRAHQSV